MRRLGRIIVGLFSLGLFFSIVGTIAVVGLIWHFSRDLPDYQSLADYEPPVISRVHAGDGSLIAEFARERRLFVPIEAIPPVVIGAFLSAEDKTFYEHPGIDWTGIASAMLRNVQNIGSGRRLVGASTITQQVAKNFLLTNEVSYTRKLREAILAFRLEEALSKDRILELYLNEIYLGGGAYGVAAAALRYFDKPLHEITAAQAAYLAALPKAPNNYHPVRRPQAALDRRNWVLGRMHEDGRIDEETRDAARAQPLGTVRRSSDPRFRAAYFAEEVRRELLKTYGEETLYEGGLSVRTTLEPRLQRAADETLRSGLIAYDRRHGWRGALATIDLAGDWPAKLAAVERPDAPADWRLAVVLKLDSKQATIAFTDSRTGVLPLAGLTWARAWIDDDERGPRIERPADVLAPGDVILVSPLTDEEEKPVEGAWALQQVPAIQGALVALDPHTGRVLAMSGGFSFEDSEFNRATQARRQPGSSFKPFVYAAALDHGFTPASIVLDAPIVIDQGGELGKWKPGNYSNKFYGPSTLRLGIEKSRNLMTVRLAQRIGMPVVVDYARRFGIDEDLEPYLPMALGAGETSLLQMTTGYAMLVNGGRRIVPTLIDRIQNRRGRTVARHDGRACGACRADWPQPAVPELRDERERVVDAGTAFQMVSMLEGVVQRGTGVRIRAVGKPLAGKTGTTNESRDAWFIGFSPDLAVGVFTGFDEPRPLGKRETGSSVAVPIFRDFMQIALADQPAIPFRVPRGIRLVRIDAVTGRRATPGQSKVILEAFKPGTEPGFGAESIDAGRLLRSDVGGSETAIAPAPGILSPPGGSAAPLPPAGGGLRRGSGGLY